VWSLLECVIVDNFECARRKDTRQFRNTQNVLNNVKHFSTTTQPTSHSLYKTGNTDINQTVNRLSTVFS